MYRLLITVLLLTGSLYATSQDTNSNQEKLIYIMPLHKGWELVEQCTRSVYYPDSFWRVTEGQVSAIEKRLIKKIQQLREQNAPFVPEDLSNYKRQYIGFEMDGQSYYYGNFFPKTASLEFDPSQKGVVTCRSDKRYWSMLFNIDSFKFETIERNDKMVKPKGAMDPRFYDEEPPEPEK
ncbi:hypothetical protein [Pleionea mediterranea]|jgi:hypothetical protein|uniref:Uncharacterized protein n=1 Tax=Pleionea mediterranea TaxID=523701 RepID=A0A316FZ03_9GAMM|nr:hypothetical protein [Pleionea mediterranea]PWK53622.1 hypothetical protein C8D97_10210 [Pleionea mediterranea]